MGKASKCETLDGDAVPIKEMTLTKAEAGGAKLKFRCYRCEAAKEGTVKAAWPTSRGVKTLCQGCAGQVHRLATAEAEDAPAKKKKKKKAASADMDQPAGCCAACANILFAAGVGHLACVDAWLAAGGDVEYGGRKKIERPLHKAAANGYVEVADRLLTAGADVNARDKARRTALYRAAESAKSDVVRLLLGRGADATLAAGDMTKTKTKTTTTTPLEAATAALDKKRSHMAKSDDERDAMKARADNRQTTVDLLAAQAGAKGGSASSESAAKTAASKNKEGGAPNKKTTTTAKPTKKGTGIGVGGGGKAPPSKKPAEKAAEAAPRSKKQKTKASS